MKYLKIALISAVVIAGIVALGVTQFSTTIRKQIFSTVMPVDYFTAYNHIGPTLYQVSGSVYAFEKAFARSLVLRTSDGVAVIDTFDPAHMKALKQALAEQFSGEAIRWIIFSHNHLDHIRGSDLFPDAEIIGHQDINQFVADWPQAGKTVAQVTRAIAGDQTLTLGDLTIEALYMPLSHSHTLYGFYIPSDNVVFAPDMMFVNAVPPFGFPDFYYPGYIRALDRLIALNAEHYVPSHMDRGTRDDLIAYRDMTVDFQEVVKEEALKIGLEEGGPSRGLRSAIRSAYDRLHPKYGDLHGFDAMFVAKFGRHFGGSYLGF